MVMVREGVQRMRSIPGNPILAHDGKERVQLGLEMKAGSDRVCMRYSSRLRIDVTRHRGVGVPTRGHDSKGAHFDV